MVPNINRNGTRPTCPGRNFQSQMPASSINKAVSPGGARFIYNGVVKEKRVSKDGFFSILISSRQNRVRKKAVADSSITGFCK